MTAVACTNSTGSLTLGSGGDVITFAGRPRTGVWIYNAGATSLWVLEGSTPPTVGAPESTEIPAGAMILKSIADKTRNTIAVNGSTGAVYSAELGA